MAYVQNTKIPANQKLTFSLKDFSGGMNNRSDQIADNEGSVVLNLMFADDSLLETRYGQKYFDEEVIDGAIVYIDEFKPYNDADKLIKSSETTMYIGDDEVPVVGIPSGVNHLGKYYFSDGKTYKVYGKFEQEESIHTKIIGKPIDEYMVFEVISPPEPIVEVPEEPVDPPIEDPEEDEFGNPFGTEYVKGIKYVNYTDKTVYYLPCKLELLDTSKGANVITDSVKYLISHEGRIFMSGNEKDDDNIFISDLQNPLYFPVSLPIQIPPTSDEIMGLHVFDDGVVVGRKYDIFIIKGKTNNPELGVEVFSLRKLNTHTGFASHHAVDIAHNYLIFLGTDGNVYGLRNIDTPSRDLATTILSRTIDLYADPINLSKEDLFTANSHFYNDEWYLNIKDKTLVYSYRHMAWVMYEGLDVTSCYGYDGEWIWGRPEGRIATFDKENFFDFGEPYQTLWYSKFFDMGNSSKFKQFREFFLVAYTFNLQYSDIYVTFEIDYSDVKDRAVISNQVSRWGFAKFGDRFISRRINESFPFVIGRRGRAIRFKITNNYDLDSIIDDYSELENYPEKREGLVVKLKDVGYYLYTKRDWKLLEEKEFNQRMKIHQINGEYEMRGNR